MRSARPSLRYSLEAGMLIEGVDGDVGAPSDQLGFELAAGAAFAGADLPVEDDLDVNRAAEIEIVADQGFEEPAGVAVLGEHDRAGDLDLGHGQLPPVTGIPIG